MRGAIVGDILGAPHEFIAEKEFDFPIINRFIKFTDDTVLTIAVADSLMNSISFKDNIINFALNNPNKGYGGNFKRWIHKPKEEQLPYNSLGNGSAMRVSPVAWFYDSLDEVLDAAKRSSEVTHNNPEGIRSAKAVASAIYLARTGNTKEQIRNYLQEVFYYDLTRSYDHIYDKAFFDETGPISVPEAIICFLDSNSFEDSIRKAINLGADADTQAAIAGGISEAFYKGVPDELWVPSKEKLTPEFVEISDKFTEKYVLPKL